MGNRSILDSRRGSAGPRGDIRKTFGGFQGFGRHGVAQDLRGFGELPTFGGLILLVGAEVAWFGVGDPHTPKK